MSNPWSLSPGEERALQAYITCGSDKAAAYALGKSDNTITEQLRTARHKMKVATRVHMALAYDRWHRAALAPQQTMG